MNQKQPEEKPDGNFFHRLDKSAILTVVGIILLFSGSVIVTLIAPRYVDPTWTSPSSSYQVQMYEVSDPNLYISSASGHSSTLQFVYHIKENFTLLLFQESEYSRIVAPDHLKKYITAYNEPVLTLTSKLLLLRSPEKSDHFDAIAAAGQLRTSIVNEWEKNHPKWKEEGTSKPNIQIMELYEPDSHDAFALALTDGMIENWVDHDFRILDETPMQNYHKDSGVIYVRNPSEFRITNIKTGNVNDWVYDPKGEAIQGLDALKSHPAGFHSRAELIAAGEHIYAIEGCWYCHTDQTRTLVQDVMLNGSDSHPAPPSTASEYIYQKITFPGTRRIGPDLSRVGVKRSSRDWHKTHFQFPQTASKGSIMPAFRHFFDDDPRGTSKNTEGIPNYQFEAIFQYLMTKGTRITPPTQAWWLGKDPVGTKEIIEGRGHLNP